MSSWRQEIMGVVVKDKVFMATLCFAVLALLAMASGWYGFAGLLLFLAIPSVAWGALHKDPSKGTLGEIVIWHLAGWGILIGMILLVPN